MRKLIESTFVSLDGVVESPQQWALPFWGDEHRRYATQQLADCDAFLFGRVTYEQFAASWPQRTGDPYYDRVNSLPKFVVSSTLREVGWNATVLEGEAGAAIRSLKAQSGANIIKYGTSALDRTLMPERLIDEIRVLVFPIVVGSGRRLYEGIDVNRLGLELTSSKTFSNGVTALNYVVG